MSSKKPAAKKPVANKAAAKKIFLLIFLQSRLFTHFRL